MIDDRQERIARREASMRTRREAADHRWQARQERRPPIDQPELHDGWLDGPAGVFRAALILVVAMLLGLAWAEIERAATSPVVEGPRA